MCSDATVPKDIFVIFWGDRRDSVRNIFLAVARKIVRPGLGIAPCSVRYASAFRVPHALCAGTVLNTLLFVQG